MNLLSSLVVGVLFGSGVSLMLKRDLIWMVAGTSLITYAAILFIMAAALPLGAAPIHPLPEGEAVSDPLVQALALTATVINFGMSALALGLVYRIHVELGSTEIDELRLQEEHGEMMGDAR